MPQFSTEIKEQKTKHEIRHVGSLAASSSLTGLRVSLFAMNETASQLVYDWWVVTRK